MQRVSTDIKRISDAWSDKISSASVFLISQIYIINNKITRIFFKIGLADYLTQIDRTVSIRPPVYNRGSLCRRRGNRTKFGFKFGMHGKLCEICVNNIYDCVSNLHVFYPS